MLLTRNGQFVRIESRPYSQWSAARAAYFCPNPAEFKILVAEPGLCPTVILLFMSETKARRTQF